nr:hypothetical protein [Shimia isoporae]
MTISGLVQFAFGPCPLILIDLANRIAVQVMPLRFWSSGTCAGWSAIPMSIGFFHRDLIAKMFGDILVDAEGEGQGR